MTDITLSHMSTLCDIIAETPSLQRAEPVRIEWGVDHVDIYFAKQPPQSCAALSRAGWTIQLVGADLRRNFDLRWERAPYFMRVVRDNVDSL